MALQNLMEGVLQQLDDLAEKEMMCEGPFEESMRPDGSWGGFSETQSFWTILPRVRITKIAMSTMLLDGSALEIPTITLLSWCAPMSPSVRPPIATIVIPPSSMVTQSHPMVTPIALVATQFGEGSTIFWEYVERTITRMRAPPQEPP